MTERFHGLPETTEPGSLETLKDWSNMFEGELTAAAQQVGLEFVCKDHEEGTIYELVKNGKTLGGFKISSEPAQNLTGRENSRRVAFGVPSAFHPSLLAYFPEQMPRFIRDCFAFAGVNVEAISERPKEQPIFERTKELYNRIVVGLKPEQKVFFAQIWQILTGKINKTLRSRGSQHDVADNYTSLDEAVAKFESSLHPRSLMRKKAMLEELIGLTSAERNAKVMKKAAGA